jgi:hypothetical protein
MATFLEEIRGWLDTETRAILCPVPPQKLVSVGVESYSLLLLKNGEDQERTDDIVTAIRDHAPPTLEYPFVIGQGMDLDDALAGQFALACCDCVGAFVADELVNQSALDLFRQLLSEVLSSPEFERVQVNVEHIPQTDVGRRFSWQFFGLATGLPAPATYVMYRKKERLMEHCAAKAGAAVRVPA